MSAINAVVRSSQRCTRLWHCGKTSASMLKSVPTFRTMSTVEAEETRVVPRRALLYIPALAEGKVTKGAGLDVDTVCLDLEDGVALNRKDVAREAAVQALNDVEFGNSERAVRINQLQSEVAKQDIEALMSAPKLPDCIVIPKVESVEDLIWFFDLAEPMLGERKDEMKYPMNCLVQIESAKGMLNLREICQADQEEKTEALLMHLDGLILGGDDLAANIGATRTRAASELLYARQNLVMHAKAYGLQAIDIVNIHFKDPEFLTQECSEGAIMGFTGKQIIHPDQLNITQSAFTPSDERIQFALELEEAFQAHQEEGTGAFTFQEQMIDMPTLLQCQNILEIARSVNKIPRKEKTD
eukprot:m.157339 g.157339  ORF g.157339 m.157339 type:complete len:356 (-) comp15114_c0_seq1:566-1633(-)